MKQYKHKSTGEIFTGQDWYRNEIETIIIPHWLIENSCDWEEIKEKEYKILSFKYPTGELYERLSNGKFQNLIAYPKFSYPRGFEASEDTFLKQSCVIHSVKRLSDGEVFTVGDKTNRGTIVNIKLAPTIDIPNSGVIIRFTNGNITALCYKANIQDDISAPFYLQKAKQPLFTTEDGIDVHIGDQYFELIIPGFHNKECVWNILTYRGRDNINYDQIWNRNNRLWFSTKESAEEYIFMNKPCLSMKDIKDHLVRRTPHTRPRINIGGLQELVKERLKI